MRVGVRVGVRVRAWVRARVRSRVRSLKLERSQGLAPEGEARR